MLRATSKIASCSNCWLTIIVPFFAACNKNITMCALTLSANDVIHMSLNKVNHLHLNSLNLYSCLINIMKIHEMAVTRLAALRSVYSLKCWILRFFMTTNHCRQALQFLDFVIFSEFDRAFLISKRIKLSKNPCSFKIVSNLNMYFKEPLPLPA